MSRHTVEARDPDRFECIVGYDPPLDTFFGQVIDREILARLVQAQEERKRTDAEATSEVVEPDFGESEDEDYFVLWVGTTVGEVPTVEALTAALAPYVSLTAEIGEWLRRDREREAHPPTRHQQMIRSLLDDIAKKQS